MKYQLPAIVMLLLIGIIIGLNIPESESPPTIRSRHRLTPRLELVIDSGRVDTVFVYKLK